MKSWLCGLCMFILSPAFSQVQTCPANINFGNGDLTHWFAYTGNNKNGNDSTDIKVKYDSTSTGPSGTIGVKTIAEYNLSSVQGIQVITNVGRDAFGGFATIPTVNGYAYQYAILLGSTAVSHGGQGGSNQGGYIRGVKYRINVPAASGPTSQPYTMTYAYAMVLENGSHNSNEQPFISVTLSTHDSVITCASPAYYLPTFNNTTEGGRGATLDTVTAERNGFSLSPVASPNPNPDPTVGGGNLRDVWTKGWTEVTFDLSPYRGQQVVLTFEADNCIPGGHFAYGYIALRNSCNGLTISGDSLVCVNSNITYSIPGLAGATYEWLVPGTWQIISDSTTSNTIHVLAGNQPGLIVVKEQNSCARLQDTMKVNVSFPGIGGVVNGDATVCAGENTKTLLLTGNVGRVVQWISSNDGTNWIGLPDTTNTYTANNLNATTTYKVLVQNGTVCAPDSSSGASIIVDQKSVGGTINPVSTNICEDQTLQSLLTLTGNTGKVVNWQLSQDTSHWQDFNPADTNASYIISGINASTQYRTVVKNGVCDPDTSSVAYVKMFYTPFPQAYIDPRDTTICYGDSANLYASITIGTSYAWTNFNTLNNQGNGNIGFTPYAINAIASPLTTTDFVLSIQNAGCPNALNDTFTVNVLPQIIVDPGRDTAVVVNQPLQLQVSTNDPTVNSFTWSPATGLDNPDIFDPLATLGANIDIIKYSVRAMNAAGCHADGHITVRVFKTLPDIFVPNAFTPGKNINNIFRPIPVGITSIQFFRVYNRYGMLVYSTSAIGQGWDGRVNGKPQDSGGYVWMVKGTDYLGRTIFKKGIMVLVE